MTWWVTVAAVRIHNWIQQTPKLSHMRGASRALSVRTSPRAVGVLDAFPSVQVKERESGVDGVVVATAPDADTAAAYARSWGIWPTSFRVSSGRAGGARRTATWRRSAGLWTPSLTESAGCVAIRRCSRLGR